jgi:hypothetical protein
MPRGWNRPCLALLALLLSAFGVQRWAPAATVAADEDDRPCLGAVDTAPLAGALALLPDDAGGLPPAWEWPAPRTSAGGSAALRIPAAELGLAPACALRRGAAGGARAP